MRNGHPPRTSTTTASGPGAEDSAAAAESFFPLLLERRRWVNQSLFAVIMEAYLHGTCTRKVDVLVKALGTDSGISRSEMSRICADLDAEVAVFRDRSLAGQPFPYVLLDAAYCKSRVRPPGRLPGHRGRHQSGRRRASRSARVRRRGH